MIVVFLLFMLSTSSVHVSRVNMPIIVTRIQSINRSVLSFPFPPFMLVRLSFSILSPPYAFSLALAQCMIHISSSTSAAHAAMSHPQRSRKRRLAVCSARSRHSLTCKRSSSEDDEEGELAASDDSERLIDFTDSKQTQQTGVMSSDSALLVSLHFAL